MFNCSNENKFGSVGGFKDNPDTLASQLTSISESHEPLNPVCPVIKIFFPLKKRFIVFTIYFQIYQGAVLLFHNSCNASWSRFISMHFQNPSCLYALSSPSLAKFSSGSLSNMVLSPSI